MTYFRNGWYPTFVINIKPPYKFEITEATTNKVQIMQNISEIYDGAESIANVNALTHPNRYRSFLKEPVPAQTELPVNLKQFIIDWNNKIYNTVDFTPNDDIRYYGNLTLPPEFLRYHEMLKPQVMDIIEEEPWPQYDEPFFYYHRTASDKFRFKRFRTSIDERDRNIIVKRRKYTIQEYFHDLPDEKKVGRKMYEKVMWLKWYRRTWWRDHRHYGTNGILYTDRTDSSPYTHIEFIYWFILGGAAIFNPYIRFEDKFYSTHFLDGNKFQEICQDYDLWSINHCHGMYPETNPKDCHFIRGTLRRETQPYIVLLRLNKPIVMLLKSVNQANIRAYRIMFGGGMNIKDDGRTVWEQKHLDSQCHILKFFPPLEPYYEQYYPYLLRIPIVSQYCLKIEELNPYKYPYFKLFNAIPPEYFSEEYVEKLN